MAGCFTPLNHYSWWRHQMGTFSALLTLCVGNSPVTGDFPTQRPVTRSFDVFSDLCLIKRLSKQSWGWWFETPSRSLWRHCNNQPRLICHQVHFNHHLNHYISCRHQKKKSCLFYEYALFDIFSYCFRSGKSTKGCLLAVVLGVVFLILVILLILFICLYAAEKKDKHNSKSLKMTS